MEITKQQENNRNAFEPDAIAVPSPRGAPQIMFQSPPELKYETPNQWFCQY